MIGTRARPKTVMRPPLPRRTTDPSLNVTLPVLFDTVTVSITGPGVERRAMCHLRAVVDNCPEVLAARPYRAPGSGARSGHRSSPGPRN